MEKQEPSQPIFDPEQVNEQVEYLVRIQDTQMQDATPGARTLAALKRVTAENEQILTDVWTQLALHKAARQALEHESTIVDLLQSRQRKEDTMLQTDFMPQLNTIESQPKPTPHHNRRLFALVAALLLVLLVSSFVTLLSLTHASSPHMGSLPLATTSPHPTIQSTLPVPSKQVTYSTNPAAKIITSVGISNSQSNGQITMLVNKFTVGETIYLVCGAQTTNEKAPGSITIKWYMNNHFYRTDTTQHSIQPKQSVTAIFTIAYVLPAEGKAEVYWNDQLAATVLFVVEP